MLIDKQKLDIILAEKGMALNDVSLKSTVSKPTLMKIKRRQDVHPITVGKIARALGVPVVDLVKIN